MSARNKTPSGEAPARPAAEGAKAPATAGGGKGPRPRPRAKAKAKAGTTVGASPEAKAASRPRANAKARAQVDAREASPPSDAINKSRKRLVVGSPEEGESAENHASRRSGAPSPPEKGRETRPSNAGQAFLGRVSNGSAPADTAAIRASAAVASPASAPTVEPRPADRAGDDGGAPVAVADSIEARLEALERRIERGLRFLHVVVDRNQRGLEQHAALIHGLGDRLASAGAIRPAEVAAARDAYLATAPAPTFRVRVAPDVDKYAARAVSVDCAARLPLCKAACCRRPFALSTQDLEEGIVRWDLGDPYVNRRDASGRCCHHRDDGACGVYAARPLRCRSFDCREDAAIWIDFDRGIPHPDLAALPTPRADA